MSKEKVDHPAHYGGADNPYEVIKVIEAWKLGFNLGNAVKYIARAELKGAPLEDLKKAVWYLVREIGNRSNMVTSPKLAPEFTPMPKASDHPKTARPSPNHTKYEHGSIWPSQEAWEIDMINRRVVNDGLGRPVVEELARIDHMTWLTFNK